MAWHFDINSNDTVPNFAAELGKSTTSKGSFSEDYSSFCSLYSIVGCPFLIPKFDSNTGSTTLFASNSKIDLSSWRMALLALTTTGSLVNSVQLHNSEIGSQHILDLSQAIVKLGAIKNLKLDYCIIGATEAHQLRIDALKSLLNGNACIEYLSLKGCKLGDELIVESLPALQTNCNLIALNLSDNSLSSSAITAAIRSLRMNTSLTCLSLSSNQADDDCLAVLRKLLLGEEATTEDQQLYKKQIALVGEKNKAIKANNKKKKKSGEEEQPELPVPDRIFTVDGKPTLINKSVSVVDLSNNTGVSPSGVMALAESLWGSHAYSHWGTEGYCPLTIHFRGIVKSPESIGFLTNGSNPEKIKICV